MAFPAFPALGRFFLLISYSVAKADGFDQCHSGDAMSLAKIATALKMHG
jgi:hypothetical protein